MKTTVAVMFGGKSVEHEVSIISGIQAIANMNTEKYDIVPVYITKSNHMYVGDGIGDIERYKDIPGLLKTSSRVLLIEDGGNFCLESYPHKMFGDKKIRIDIAFPIVHGTNEEDGTLQGYLKTIGIPFVGCDVTASAVGMDKYIMKTILKDNDVPVLDCLHFTQEHYADIEAMMNLVEEKLSYPVIVKPANLGSSVGISVARNRDELTKSIDDAYLYATKILIEHAILNLREINCAVLGDESEAKASECEEPMHTKDILSYEDKYLSSGNGSKSGKSSGMAGVSRKLPAELSDDRRSEVRELAVRTFKSLGCNGVARIDFMIDEDTDKLYVNEINTIPGSLSFYLWEPMGMSYTELLDELIELSYKRSRLESGITYTFDTNILSSGALGGSKGSKGSKVTR